MTESDRKKGHEILDEEWHEFVDSKFQVGDICSCGNVVRHGQLCGTMRTFTTPDDAYALEQALVRDGLQGEFREYIDKRGGYSWQIIYYIEHTPEQRCQLIIDFYKEELFEQNNINAIEGLYG